MPARPLTSAGSLVVAAASGLYDIVLGAALLAGRGLLTALFDISAPSPPIHADLNGLFLLAIGAGYVLPFRRPDRYRGYVWVMGPFLKDRMPGVPGGSLRSATRRQPTWCSRRADGSLALVTFWALWITRARTP